LYRHWRNANNLHFPRFKLILRCSIFKRTCREGDAALRYLFEEYVLDTDRRELRRGVEVIPTAPQVLDLLNYLICNKGRVVSKDDLIGAVWNGRIVSDAALTTRMNAARSAIGDTGEKQHLIKTVPRKGFRFVAVVREEQEPKTTHGGRDRTRIPTQRPSIVVLPFANLSGDPEQDYFVDGVTENLTTDLSRVGGSFVIGRHTAFTYKNKAVDLKEVGRDLNVDYVLEGSVQRGGNRLRVNAQLVDAETARICGRIDSTSRLATCLNCKTKSPPELLTRSTPSL
jgi:TolB-like protein